MKTQCGDMYVFNQRLLQYPEDRPAQNCVNMYGGLMAPLARSKKAPNSCVWPCS
jgi:hypothetical protein